MSIFLEAFAKTVPDDAQKLVVPDKVTSVALPLYSPELNPVERVWLYL